MGFEKIKSGAYTKNMQGFLQGISLCPDASVKKFWVPVGLLIPALWEKEKYVLGGHDVGYKISHRMGNFRNNMTGLEQRYFFYIESELRRCFDKVYHDYVEQAVPWLERFPTLADVVAEYYRYRIGPPSTRKRPGPDPFGWATYGWMLEELGHMDESREWLSRAYDQIHKPTYMKHGVRVNKGTWGARKIPKSQEEERLTDLLRQSLELPVE